jgi:hypothetical protein
MESSKKFMDENLQGEELEKFTEKFLAAKFDRDRKQRWQKILAEKHGVKPPRQKRSKSKAKVLYLWIGAIAAAILLLFVLNPGLFQFSEPPYQQLADNYLTQDFFQNQGASKGDEDVELLKLNAVMAYNRKDFLAAIDNYEKVIASDDGEEQHFFFLGMSYLYNENYDKAVEVLSPIAAKEEGAKFKQEAQWFLSLAYLKSNNPNEARLLLELIKNGSWNADKASLLLEALE